jgi:hypothetical protein
MEIKRYFKFVTLMSVLVVMVMAAAVPTGVGQAAMDLSRLTVHNRNSSPIYLWLEGPTFYYFKIEAGERVTFTVDRGDYDYRARGCGRTAEGTLDLTGNKTLIMPICGGGARQAAKRADTVDLGQTLKVVPVVIENNATGRSLIILTGPSTYVFTLEKDKTYDGYTIGKGEYDVQVYACGDYGKRTFTAYKDSVLKIDCP